MKIHAPKNSIKPVAAALLLSLGMGVSQSAYALSCAAALAAVSAQINIVQGQLSAQISQAEASINQQTISSEKNVRNQMTDFEDNMEELIKKMSQTLQGEISKQTKAMKKVEEAIATYDVQEQLRRDAVEVGERFHQPKFTCQTMAMASSVGSASANTRARALEYTTARLNKRVVERDVRRRILNSYDRSTEKYCTDLDIQRGFCKTNTPDLRNGDINAAYMFGSASEQGLTYDPKQSGAVDAYIERLAGSPAPALPMKCETDQCKAYEELRKDYEASISLPMYSMAEISSAYVAQPGLGTKSGVKKFLGGKDDISMMESIDAFIRMKFSPEGIIGSGQAPSEEAVLRELAQNQAFRLWIDFQSMRQFERIEAMQAAELAALSASRMKPQLDAQRAAAIASATK